MSKLVQLRDVPWGGQFRLPGNAHVMTHERGDTLWSWVSWVDSAGKQEGKMYIGEEVYLIEQDNSFPSLGDGQRS